MSMSKKDFIALADTIREHNRLQATYSTPDVNPFDPNHLETIAMFCRKQNSAFKTGRWLAYIAGKCGPNGGAR